MSNKFKKYGLVIYLWVIGFPLLVLLFSFFGSEILSGAPHFLLAWSQKFEEDPIELFTLALAVSTIFLWADTNGLRKLALKQSEDMQASLQIARDAANAAVQANDISRDIFVATERPWVTAAIRAGSPLTYDVDGLNVALQLTLKNVGHSPAKDVFVDLRLLSLTQGNADPSALLQEMVNAAKQRPPGCFGHQLFPGSTFDQNISTATGKDQLEQLLKEIDFVILHAVICISYRFVFESGVHHTGYVLDIQRSKVPRQVSIDKNRALGTIFPDEGDIPAEELRILHSPIFSIAD